MRNPYFAASAALSLLFSTPVFAASDNEIEAVKAEIQAMRQSYENRIAELESKLVKIESQKPATQQAAPPAPAPARQLTRTIRDNSFNPSLGLILNGK